MSQEILDNLFKDYNTFDNEEEMNKEGTGLGLSICKKIVNLLGVK
jgi:signal transduction histidine kinase